APTATLFPYTTLFRSALQSRRNPGAKGVGYNCAIAVVDPRFVVTPRCTGLALTSCPHRRLMLLLPLLTCVLVAAYPAPRGVIAVLRFMDCLRIPPHDVHLSNHTPVPLHPAFTS